MKTFFVPEGAKSETVVQLEPETSSSKTKNISKSKNSKSKAMTNSDSKTSKIKIPKRLEPIPKSLMNPESGILKSKFQKDKIVVASGESKPKGVKPKVLRDKMLSNLQHKVQGKKSKPSSTNPKGPIKVWVPKSKIVNIVDMIKSKGCSRHMTGEKSMFLSLTMKEGGNVKFRGNQSDKIIGTRTIGNPSISINNVWLVDGLDHNLLSISQFCDNCYDVMFGKTNYTVVNKDGNSIVFKGKRIENVYKINFCELVDQKVVCLLSVNDKKWVWHRRLGHPNWRLISKLSKLQLVKGLPNIEYHSDALSSACQKGKIVKSSFETKDIVSTSRPLELLHIDSFGPVNTASLYGSKYGLVIVDDYSRWTWVKFLRSKDNAYDVFSNFCTQIQSEKEMMILKVRSDHGGEFENETFETFCEKHGIIHEFSSPRTPQQNGVV